MSRSENEEVYVDKKLYEEMKKFINDIAVSMNLSAVDYQKSKVLSQKLK